MFNLLTIFFIAIGLSMDTFSLSIIYGTIGLERKKAIFLSVIVGIFHFIMPLFGNLIGHEIINKLPINSDIIVGLIFIIIAIQMIIQKEEIVSLKKISSFLIFGVTVSLDSFSVGIGISAITNNFFSTYTIFAITSFLFTSIGLFFGKNLNKIFGNISTKIGAIILFVLGISYIF